MECGLNKKKLIVFHILYIIVASLCPVFLKHADFYRAHHSEKRGVLWLASYTVRCDWPNTSSVRRKCYTPYRIVMPCPGATKKNKTHYKRGICSIQWGQNTDYNDLYCLFMRHVASCCINIMKYENILTGCESESQTDHKSWNRIIHSKKRFLLFVQFH